MWRSENISGEAVVVTRNCPSLPFTLCSLNYEWQPPPLNYKDEDIQYHNFCAMTINMQFEYSTDMFQGNKFNICKRINSPRQSLRNPWGKLSRAGYLWMTRKQATGGLQSSYLESESSKFKSVPSSKHTSS